MINQLLGKVFGTKNERVIKSLMPNVQAINALEPQIQKLTDDELRAKTDEFRQRIQEQLSRVSKSPQPEAAEAAGDDEPDLDLQKQFEKQEYEAIQEVLESSGAASYRFHSSIDRFRDSLIALNATAVQAKSAAGRLLILGQEVRGPEDIPVRPLLLLRLK